MKNAAIEPRLTFEDWLAIERAAIDQRSEFVAGEVFAMAGASETHNLIVEVLSDSTEAYDRGDKLLHDRSLPSLLSQQREQADLFARQPDGTWNPRGFREPSDSIELAAVDASLSMAEIDDKVEWPGQA